MSTMLCNTRNKRIYMSIMQSFDEQKKVIIIQQTDCDAIPHH